MAKGILRSVMLDYHVLSLFWIIFSQQAGSIDYCEGETFRGVCEQDAVIVMTSALYGRMNLGRCLRMDYGNIGCSSNVLTHMDGQCSGRRACDVRVSSIVDIIRDIPQPCPKDLRSYLEAGYECMPITPGTRRECTSYGFLVVNASQGVIANVITEEEGVGSINCPWVIKSKPGQRINFTLHDFGISSREFPDGFRHGVEICQHVYATIKESGVTKKICGGRTRITHAYTSVTDTVEVRVFGESEVLRKNYFVLKYHVIGCPDPEAPSFGWVEKIDGATAKLHCNGSDTWRKIRCEGGSWIGVKLECPPAVISGASTLGTYGSIQEFSIVIIASVAIIIASAVLTVGLLCIKRHREERAHRLHEMEAEAARIYYSGGRKEEPRGDPRSIPPPPPPCDGSYPPINSENDYYRTWQMQRHPGGMSGTTLPRMDRPSDLGMPMPPPPGSKYTFAPVEHIYESPKFDRRDVQYYELDPSAVQDDNRSFSTDRSNNNRAMPGQSNTN